MTQFYIYQYVDPIRNEIIYIGKGTGFRSRHHLRRKDKHPLTQRIAWIRNNGAEPVISVIEFSDELSAVNEEIRLIAEIGRKDLGKGTLLNLTDGGDGKSGHPHSENTKKKISESLRGRPGHSLSKEHRQAISTAQKGKSVNFTDEMRKNMSEAKIGKKRKPFSEETKQKMRASSRIRWENTKIDK